ncbi:MAG: excinuclease ABC subunit UvrC [Micrococcales bacterium]|nr:excinuclease ABC subunit UvrC [Micrococcales bacterium]MBT5430977.1 excinuclease ABC subunit UvrC [Micrococcales bacterium]
MANDLAFRPKTSEIPTEPGVYRFLDATGRVLYVGKAKNLRARLSNYFGPLKSLHERTQRMLLSASDVKWTIVASEYEALQLEFTWIKEFEPPFNVRFRDDKSYPYLAISMKDEAPRAFVTRNRELSGVRYFGPYTQSWAIRDTLDSLLRVYPVRSCSSGVYQRAKRTGRPCLLAEIGKCTAPCVDRISKPDHKSLAKRLGDFIGSGDQGHVTRLRKRMQTASDEQNFELAARLRDDIAALESVLEKSTVVLDQKVDADLIGLARDELSAAVSIFIVRGGRIRGTRSLVVDLELDRSNADLLEYLLQEIYSPNGKSQAPEVPKQILVSELPNDQAALEVWLTELRAKPTTIAAPKRGDKAALLSTTSQNAKHALTNYKLKRVSDFSARAEALSGLQKALGLENAPLRIECYDISHLSGSGTVGSMVVFEDGLPRKDQYRKFNLETADDTESIYQVLLRRLKYLASDEPGEKFSYRPSLLVIDGGLPQLHAAERALTDSGIAGMSVISLAKRLEEVYVSGTSYPTILPRTSEELFLLQRIRDEAHRFAISAQRATRSKGITSALLEIPGLGEQKARLLLRKFGSIKRLKLASEAEIASLPGFGDKLAKIVADHLSDS